MKGQLEELDMVVGDQAGTIERNSRGYKLLGQRFQHLIPL